MESWGTEVSCYVKDGEEGRIFICKGMMTFETPEQHIAEWQRIFGLGQEPVITAAKMRRKPSKTGENALGPEL